MQISLNYKFLITLLALFTLVSGALSVLLTELLWRLTEQVPLWGQQSIATHLFAYSVIVGFVLGWCATKATRRALRTGRVLPLHWHLKSQTLIDRLPSRTFNRAFMLALAGAIIAALMVMLLSLTSARTVPHAEYLVLSTIYSVLLAGAITVMGVYRALADRTLHHSRA